MNRDFIRPAAIFVIAAVFTGLVARILPEWHNDFFSLRKWSGSNTCCQSRSYRQHSGGCGNSEHLQDELRALSQEPRLDAGYAERRL
jgi:hypothetical protein